MSSGAIVLMVAAALAVPVRAPVQGDGQEVDFARLGLAGASVYLQTRESCDLGRVTHASAGELLFEGQTPRRAPRRIDARDIVAIVRLEHRTGKASRIAATIGLGALAVVAATRDRPRLAAGLGVSAALVPWWGSDEPRSGLLVYLAPDAPPVVTPGPETGGCQLTISAARRQRR